MRAIKVINVNFNVVSEIDSPVNKFLNDELTGEIYNILIERGVGGSAEHICYNFFYELLDKNEDYNEILIQRKIDNSKTSKNKPKLL